MDVDSCTCTYALYKIHNNNNRHTDTAASMSRLVKDLSHSFVCLNISPGGGGIVIGMYFVLTLRLHTESIM